ncbi:MAG: hypothetical protein A3K19_29805 [Lentisphaerae bacterium RIFOXYB12_FULL_65_16]|nr:MAG: hypothetical protein A3K18_33415 [Lentisphaerae bacterium RIFOXYA12_64_32]OGV86524.1 MAG: hypothetical protein A3K19_29805 [Lentisphaerae bacterium RIFOXYB12_FULL_65_16]
MQAVFSTANGRPLNLHVRFQDFLHSPVIRRPAATAMCEPQDLIRDFVRVTDSDPDELRDAVAEAVMLATDYAVTNVELDRSDLAFVRRHFAHGTPLRVA